MVVFAPRIIASGEGGASSSERTMRFNFSKILISLVVVLIGAITASVADGQARTSTPDQATMLFTDEANGYSIRYPITWKREPIASAPGPAVRLFLSTPGRNYMVVSLYPLPTRVMRYSSALFEKVGHDHVDTVVSIYRNLLKFKQSLREQPEDHSDDRSMIFWQGISALDDRQKPWALVSEHVIRYGSDMMINMIFIGSNDVTRDGADMDRVMNSLSFSAR